MSTNLFEEFEEVSAKQWKQKIQFDLKGADYNETLVWNSPDGVNVRPFYHPDETPQPLKVQPASGWSICEKIYAVSAEEANKKALEAIEKGAESIRFLIPSEEIDPVRLLEGIEENITVYLSLKFLSEDYLTQLKELLNSRKGKLYLQLDIIGKLARSGNWFHNLKKDHELMDLPLKFSAGYESVISVDSGLYQNAGATIPQELAYTLAQANEYLNHLNEYGYFSEGKKADFQVQFLTATGSNYFFEIAKLRALRLLYATLAGEYGIAETCHILAEPSKRNKTLYDFNVNLLRTTTECMSAVLGGADAVCNMPYDALYHKNNDFGNRIARNQLLILKHESYFEKAANPAEGSYYIETLTRQFAEKALEIFRDMEKGGGFLKQLKEGVIQKKINESAAREQEQFDSGELVLIGTNKYPNKQDKMKEELELYPFLKKKSRKTLLPPVIEKRLAERHEQQRLREE